MLCKDRNGNVVSAKTSQDRILRFLYGSKIGRLSLPLISSPLITKCSGRLLNSKLSTGLIDGFVANNNIDMSEYVDTSYSSYNDFFIRKIKPEVRNFEMDREVFIAPCDSKLSVYEIDDTSRFTIKNVPYTFLSLTRSRSLSNQFAGGYLLVFRLSVDDYHRYYYVDGGVKSKNYRISGKYHTVNPIATDIMPVYRENERELSLLHSDNFGDVMMMEVGATVVGKIVNYHGSRRVEKAMEKGRFEFGGSTVILAVKRDVVDIDCDILSNSRDGIETKVKLGERIGVRKR